jgi:O-antigen ligase
VRRRQPPFWLLAGAALLGGTVIGAAVAGMPMHAMVGILAVLLVTAAVIYRASLGLAILAFFYPWDLTTRVGPVKVTTSLALLAIAFVVWATKQCLRNAPELRKSPLDWPVVLFAGATVLSLVTVLAPGADPDNLLVALLKAAGGFLLYFLAVQSLEDRRDLWLVLGAVVATGLVQAVATIIPVLAGTEHLSSMMRASGTTIHANLFAGYLLLIIPLVIVAAVTLRRRWTRPVAAAATIIYGAALVATLSRSGLLGLVAGAVTLTVLLPEKRKQIGALAGALLIASFLAGMVGPFADRLAEAGANATSLDGRLLIWGPAVQIFADHFVLGIGVGNFAHVIGDRSLSHAHNLFLNIAAERGVLGLAAFGIVIAALFRTLATAFRRTAGTASRVLSAGLIASFVGFFAHSLFDATYYDYKILLLFWLLVGVSASLPWLFAEQSRELASARLAPGQ